MHRLLNFINVRHARQYMDARDPVPYLLHLLKSHNVDQTQANLLELEEALQALYLEHYL